MAIIEGVTESGEPVAIAATAQGHLQLDTANDSELLRLIVLELRALRLYYTELSGVDLMMAARATV